MSGIKDLDKLLSSMSPKLIKGKFVFCTFLESKYPKIDFEPIMTFKEKEGLTIITTKEMADKNRFKYDGEWAFITLNVHSSLVAVGFLAKITEKLANNGISCNAVSAFYHDHLFIPHDKSRKVLTLLKEFSN